MIIPRSDPRARVQPTRGLVAFSLAASLIAAPHLTAASPASAEVVDPEEGGIELSITAGVHGVIRPETSLTTTVTITNTTNDELSTGHVTIELNDTALTDGASLTEWLDSGAASGTFAPLTAEDSEPVAASESSTTTVFTPAETLGDLPSGVYPMRAKLSGAKTGDEATTSQNVTENSVLVIDSDADAQISVLVPITATPADGALLSADELTALTSAEGSLTAQLDGVAGTSAVLAVDPLIPAAVRALGTAAPSSAAEWLTRLESLPNERFMLQFGDADATVQAQAEFSELLSPLSLDPFLDEVNFVETEETSATASPTPDPTPTGPVLPTDDELTALRMSASDMLWPVGDVRTPDLTRFNALLDADATTILPSTSLASYSSARAEVDDNDVLVTEDAASDALSRAASETEDADARQAHIVEGIAHLFLTRPQTSLLVGLDRSEVRTADSLRSTIMSLATVGDPVGLAALRSAEPASATLADVSEDAVTRRVSTLNDLLSDETRLTAFASILDDPLLLRSPERLRLLRVLGVGSAETYIEDAAEHRAATNTTMNAVGVQDPTPIQLFTSAAPLPVWVRNDLPWPVNVKLTSTPSDARLDVEPTTEVIAQPASNTRVKVPVSARVGSGTLSVNFSLNSPTGVQIGVDQSATVTVRAEWESIGLVILGGVIVLLIALGTVRTVARRNKDRTDAATHAESTEEVTGE